MTDTESGTAQRVPAKNSDATLMHVYGALIDDYGTWTRVLPNEAETWEQRRRIGQLVRGGTKIHEA